MLKIISTEVPRNYNYDLPPRWLREVHAAKATAVDLKRTPHLAAHWPGFLVIDGQLAYDERNPEARQKAARLLAARDEAPGPILRRRHGLDIEMVEETHGGDFPGRHGRYFLRSTVVVEDGGKAREAA